MVKKIVFFCFAPFIKQHYKRFGAEVLESNGFEVWFYDFSPIVYPELHKASKFLTRPVIDNYFLFDEEKEAVQAIQNLGSEYFVVIAGGYYQATSFKIFQTLSKTNIPYAFYAGGTFPGGLQGIDGSLLIKFLLKLQRVNLKKLKNIFYKPTWAPLFGIRAPNVCILGGENTLKDNGAAALIGEKTELLWAHAYDYDQYLDHSHKRKTQESFAVFIDLGTPMFAWDDHLSHQSTALTCERYYPSLCRFLDYVEKELELEVVIAAHPKSKHVDYPEYFGRRRIFCDQTHHLIQKSKLVISHQSTALTYVVLEKKPLLFLTSAEHEADPSYSNFIKINALSLGTSVINIDEGPYSINWEKALLVNEAMYLKYRQKYIKKEGSEELNTWQIFANHLMK